MRNFSGIAIALAVGAVAAAAPILISVQLSWKEGLEDERTIALSYAQDALRRTTEMAQEMNVGIDQLKKSPYPACSPQDIELMRRIDLGSSYVQALGRIVGNEIVCTSLGIDKPIPLGIPTLMTSSGAEERLNVRIPIAEDHALDIFSKDGFAFLLDPRLPLDITTQGPSISMAIFVPSSLNHAVISSRNYNFRPAWFKPIAKGTSVTFINDGYVVAMVRAADIDVAVITAAPQTYALMRVRHFSFIFVPLGLLCAAGLAWAVMRLTRIQLSMPSVLRGASRRKEFFVEYQPIVEIATRRCIGAEALVRWRRGVKTVFPDNFIQSAEDSGVITEISACVAEIVAADLPALLKIAPDFCVAINLSASDLHSTATVELLQSLLETSGAKAENIHVEATEHGLLQSEKKRTHEVLDRINALGIKIAIDDFGTGYSSLSRLETLGIDILKIDKSFVATIDTDGATSQVVPHIINMAHSLRLEIIAEGVENEHQARFLRDRRVHFAQGALFGMPMSIESLHATLQMQDPTVTSPVIS